ncbi:MAG TPA: metalloregulator ArsR/SmtB family transcription factor [Pilimelia sp.]|nr:metalloregulator ArsR/SmtB family transcription factor [Pilimelia sp.]
MSPDADVVRLRALAHPIRLGMLRQLAREPEVCACDLGGAFAVSQPTVSEHLRVLREAGLVRTRRQGNQICYAAEPAAIEAVADLVATLRPDTAGSAGPTNTAGTAGSGVSSSRRPG